MENLCDICPRNCKVNRQEQVGFCKSNDNVKVSLVSLFKYEEPIISGDDTQEKEITGSGAIFFSNCNLKCCYCQNSEISAGGEGKEISVQRLSEIFRELEMAGAYNINLVTPTHFTKQIVKALEIYHPKIPIVWNTSGYEKPETIKQLAGTIDIFLTDFKYFSSESAKKYSLAPDYPEMAKASILEMRKIVPKDEIQNGLMKKGLIVRHLVLPNQTKDSLKILEWINNNLGNETFVSLMAQYVPMANAKNFPEINRKINPLEYKILTNKLIELGFKNVFLQELESACSSYTPDFLHQKSDFKI